MSSNWSAVHKFKVDGFTVEKFKSKRTGMTMVLADVESPLVNGYFVLATEANDDKGCPHTLEHLIFLGSELYPYKGVLDSLANRCMAQGTNAWTDTDHTAYTIGTAGSEGFTNLLPIFLDHILYPTITDSGYHTEVHHIDGNGEDAGVVYSEMQGRENTQSSLSWRALLQAMYPGKCGLKSETGGIMADIRELDVATVRAYHREFYRPENLCLIISGKVDRVELFKKLEVVEQRVIGKKDHKRPAMKRPWSDPVPPLTETVKKDILFPDDDETTGSVKYAWRGPAHNQFLTNTAIQVLWEYLTDSAVSPLRKVFVEVAEPYANSIGYGAFDCSHKMNFVAFANVPVAKLDEIDALFEKTMKDVLAQPFDMKRMRNVISRMLLKHISNVEQSPDQAATMPALIDFLYGNSNEDFNAVYLAREYLDQISSWKEDDFKQVLSKWFLDSPHVCIVAKPSKAYGEQIRKNEAKRIEKRKASLDLAKLSSELEKATAANDVEVPDSVLKNIPIPDASKIFMIPITSISNDPNRAKDNADQSKLRAHFDAGFDKPLPVWTQLSHVHSQFFTLTAYINTASLSPQDRHLVPLWLESLFSMPVRRANGLLSHEAVVTQLNIDTVRHSDSLGLDSHSDFIAGAFPQLVKVKLRAEPRKADLAVEWMRDLLYHIEYNVERLQVAVQKLLQDVPQHKRDGSTMVRQAIRCVNFDADNSNLVAMNFFRQNQFLTKLAKRLEDKADAKNVLEEMASFRDRLVQPRSLHIHVAVDVYKTKEPIKRILGKMLLPKRYLSSTHVSPLLSVPYSSTLAAKPRHREVVVPVGGIDSSFLHQTVPGPVSHDEPDLAALVVLVEYLTTMEGVFWKRIRGVGYAYGYSISTRVEHGLIYFTLYRAANLVKGYQESSSILDDFAAGKSKFNETELEAARSSAVFSVVSRVETMESSAVNSMVLALKRLPGNADSVFLANVQKVTTADLQRVLVKWLVPLFDKARTRIAITTTPSKLEEITQAFAKNGRKLKVVDNPDEYFAV